MNIGKILLGTLGYLLIVFPLAYCWHLVLFEDTYRQLGYFSRGEPIVALGALAILMQGLVMALVYPAMRLSGTWVGRGIKFGLLAAFFLGSCHIVAAAAKTPIEPLSTWFTIESIYLTIQFLLAGLMLGWLYRDQTS